jgi:hypothetical protein
MVELTGSTRKWFEESHRTCISDDLLPEAPSSSCSGSTNHQEKQKKDRGDIINTNVHEIRLLSQGFCQLTIPLAKANLRNLVQCYLQCLTMDVSLVCHVPFPMHPFGLPFTVSSNATIN